MMTLQRLGDYISRRYNSIKVIVTILLIWGLKEAVTTFVFSCPCVEDQDQILLSREARQAYSVAFVFVPFWIIWMIGILNHNSTWRCITGWRVQQKFTYPVRSCNCFFRTLAVTAFPPLTWLVFVLLDEQYLQCMVLDNRPTVCLDDTADDDIIAQNIRYKMLSQITACSIAFGYFTLYLVVLLLGRCCGSMSYYQMRYAEYYKQLERQALESATKEYHMDGLRNKWKTLIEHGTTDDWASVSELNPPNPVQDDTNTYYTPFTEWKHGSLSKTNKDGVADPKMVTITVKADSHNDINVSTNHHHPRGPPRSPTRGPFPRPQMPPMTYNNQQGLPPLKAVPGNTGASFTNPSLNGSIQQSTMSEGQLQYDSNSSLIQSKKKKKKKVKKTQIDTI